MTGYEVQHSLASDGNWDRATTVLVADPKETSVDVTGLQAYTAYLVRVRARSDAGAGGWSEEVLTGTLDAPPERMDAPTFRERTPGGFTVTWQAASVPVDASAVVGYDIEHRLAAGATDWTTAVLVDGIAATATSRAVTGLQVDTAYEVRVRARNGTVGGAGAGPLVRARGGEDAQLWRREFGASLEL